MTSSSTRRSEVSCAAAVGLVALLFVARAVFPGLSAEIGLRAFFLLGSLAKLSLEGWGAFLAHGCAIGFESGTSIRRAWRLLSLGLLSFFVGQLLIARYQIVLGTESPFPSPAEIFFLLAYPLLIGALIFFIKAYQEAEYPMGTKSERFALFGVVAGLYLLLTYPLLAPIARTEVPPLVKAINLAYPILDLALLLPTAFLLRVTIRFQGGRVQRVWRALLIGVVALAVGDVAFACLSILGMQQLDPLIDALFIASYGSFAWGALAQRHLLSR